MDRKHSVSLDELCQLLERLNCGAFFWSNDLELIVCNRMGSRLYGLDPAFMTPGRTYAEMLAVLPPGRVARASPADRWEPLPRPGEGGSVLADFRGGNVFEVVFEIDPPRYLIGARATFREGIFASVVTDITEREENARTIARQWSYLETMIENMDEGIALFDESDGCIAHNGRLLALCDLDPAEAETGDLIERLIGADDERLERRSLRIRSEDGEDRSVELNRTWLGDGRSILVARDVTERDTVARERARLSSIVDNIAEGTALIAGDGRMIAFNEQFLEHFGVRRGAVRSGDHVERMIALQGDLDALPLEEQERRRAERLDFVLSQHEGRAVARRELGTGRVLSVTRTPIDGASVFTYRDITDEEERRRLLERARMDAEKARRMQSEFLARMSHELRTPMQGVLGMAALLERTDLDESQRQSLDVIRASGQHMLELIEDLLTMSTIDGHAMRLNPQPVRLASLLKGAVDMVRPQLTERGLALDFDPTSVEDVVIEADGTRIKQILINLLGNAARHTPSGGIVFRTSATPRDGDSMAIEIEVEDTGPGIPDDKQEEIFDRFRQLDPDGGSVKEGVGLGLPLARSLARLMGGDVGVRSAPGGGAVFTVRLEMPTATVPDPSTG